MEVNEYLTKEERKQMEGLMKKAAERRQQKVDFGTDLKILLEEVCGFCQRHGYCNICQRYKEDAAADEELPFG